MEILSKLEFKKQVIINKLSLLTEVAIPYTNGFIPNDKMIYALTSTGALWGIWNETQYIKYNSPMKKFSKSKRKFIKAIINK